jgi:hypothetical protein
LHRVRPEAVAAEQRDCCTSRKENVESDGARRGWHIGMTIKVASAPRALRPDQLQVIRNIEAERS